MSGERGSTARRRIEGKICCWCKSMLECTPEQPPGERACDRCIQARAPRRRVYMHYMLTGGGWSLHFLEPDLRTPIPRKLTFADPEKIREMAERGGAIVDLASRQALEAGIVQGRGAVWLSLTREQYERLLVPI